MILNRLIGVKEVAGQKILQEPIYGESGMIDWSAMEKVQESVFIFVDHETQTISFKMADGDSLGCTPEDLISVAQILRGALQ